MEDDYRVFDAIVKESGDSLAITIPKPVCLILRLKNKDLVQIRIKKESDNSKK
jgi:antitoxin component of MazEF toxin-antitoxin module|tara:strand:+ start:961 stop:1119 length:159 start_codon:yes stop_codon:yes gene_type:complete